MPFCCCAGCAAARQKCCHRAALPVASLLVPLLLQKWLLPQVPAEQHSRNSVCYPAAALLFLALCFCPSPTSCSSTPLASLSLPKLYSLYFPTPLSGACRVLEPLGGRARVWPGPAGRRHRARELRRVCMPQASASHGAEGGGEPRAAGDSRECMTEHAACPSDSLLTVPSN